VKANLGELGKAGAKDPLQAGEHDARVGDQGCCNVRAGDAAGQEESYCGRGP
jgi:hypothetical protein